MPHRIHALATTLGYIIEGTLLTIGSLITGAHYTANTLVDKATMDQIRGADGALVGAVLIVVVLWLSKIADGKRMDARHKELMDLHTKNAATITALTAESIKAKLLMTAAFKSLVKQLEKRPCSGGRLADFEDDESLPVNFDPEELP